MSVPTIANHDHRARSPCEAVLNFDGDTGAAQRAAPPTISQFSQYLILAMSTLTASDRSLGVRISSASWRTGTRRSSQLSRGYALLPAA